MYFSPIRIISFLGFWVAFETSAQAARDRIEFPRFLETRLPLGISIDDLANNEATARALEATLGLGIIGIPSDWTLDVTRVKHSPAARNRGPEVMLYGHQIVNGVRVEGTDFSALVDGSGHLVVFNGSLYRVDKELVPEASLSALQATQTALSQTGRGFAPDVTTVVTEPVHLASGSKWIQQTSSGFAAAERVYDPETERVYWIIQDGTWESELEEQNGVVVRAKSLLDSTAVSAESITPISILAISEPHLLQESNLESTSTVRLS